MRKKSDIFTLHVKNLAKQKKILTQFFLSNWGQVSALKIAYIFKFIRSQSFLMVVGSLAK